MRSPLAIIRERLDREGSHERYWEDVANELRTDPQPVTDFDVDNGLDRIETGGDMLADLFARLGEDTDPGPVESGPIHGPPDPPAIPAGAVRSGQSVYDGGRRCGGCGVPSVNDNCIRCTTETR